MRVSIDEPVSAVARRRATAAGLALIFTNPSMTLAGTEERALVALSVSVVSAAGVKLGGAEVHVATAAGSVGRTIARTDDHGVATVAIEPGTPLIAVYSSERSTIAVSGSSPLVLRVVPRIATVKARNGGTRSTIDAHSATALVSGDLRSAMRLDPQYRDAREGGSDAEQINGVPLPLPGGGTSGAGHFSADLFDSVSPTDDSGSTVPNFHLIGPTTTPTQTASFGLGAYGEKRYKLTAAGRYGRFGYGLSAAGEGDDGSLHGQTFTDRSGLTYDHDDHAHELGATMQLTYDLPSTSAALSFVGAQRDKADVPTVFAGGLPSGYGPDTSLPSHDVASWLTLNRTRGRDNLLYVGVLFQGGSAVDHLDAQVAGTPTPFASDFRYHGTYQLLKAARQFDSATVYVQAKTQTFAGLADGYAETNRFGSSIGSATAGAEVRAGALTLSGHGGMANVTGPFHGTSTDTELTARLRHAALTATLDYTQAPQADSRMYGASAQVLGAPADAVIQCTNGIATVTAPSVTGSAVPVRSNLKADLSVTLPDDLKLSAGGYIASERNALVTAYAEAPLALTGAYRSALDAYFTASCPGQSLAASGIYATRIDQVPLLRSREMYVSVSRQFGRLSLSGFYERLSQVAPFAPADGSATSSIVPGAQLAFVPPARANLLASFALHDTVLAIDGLYTSANNAAALPGHVSLSLGAAQHLRRGTLSLTVQNPFGSYAGTFVSPRYAVPLTLTSGLFPTLATPLARTYRLTFTTR